ncbi:MAG: diaminopimelate decarboxylase, partial [Actinomycetes bacterium]
RYTVGTIKDVQLTEGSAPAIRKYVSVDGGMSDNMRTALYQADYTAILASRRSEGKPVISRVVGKHCESGDIVVRDIYLPSDIAATDILAVAATGAYCYSLASNYNFMTRPPVVAVRNGKVRLVVRGETESDLLSRDVKYQRELQETRKAKS